MQRERWACGLLVLVGALTLGALECVEAQVPYTCTPRDLYVNRVNNKTPITVTSAQPVLVANADQSRCQLTLVNIGAATTTCVAAAQGSPTATSGLVLAAGQQISLGPEGRGAWTCIAVSSDTTLMVLENIP